MLPGGFSFEINLRVRVFCHGGFLCSGLLLFLFVQFFQQFHHGGF